MRSFLWVALGGVWLAALCMGLVGMTAYEATPSQVGTSRPDWPAQSTLRRDPAAPTLLLFAHPHCPCTRATVTELARILVHPAQRPRVFVLFVRPAGVPAGWERGDLWRTAAAQPGVTVLADEGGREAQRFGVVTSGHTLLYDNQGRLTFSGGITASRGHEGDNGGAESLLAALGSSSLATSAVLIRFPVFGCALTAQEN